MSVRSKKKGVFTDMELVERIVNENLNTTENKKVIVTDKRNITIVPEMVGCLFGIHNGKTYVNKRITNEMIGIKLGSLVPTRKMKEHTMAAKKTNQKVKRVKK